ncbi:unnamed protein product [Danaus chrysippus]|uniref:(African queen) hypothetical protein n=1 Tax=Danaus chrysippus TaxID=151541 RepID=A0A8J2VS45_9NEOP|nr:unnamed protein product [Danaus chrysippus]
MAQLVGQEVVKDPHDPKYYALAAESLEQYQEQTGHRNLAVLEVRRATEQLVAGLITRLIFDAQSLDQNYLLLCNSKIFEPLDSSPKEITVNCERPLLR